MILQMYQTCLHKLIQRTAKISANVCSSSSVHLLLHITATKN
uniref:Uncharacterized protein n=1 Tax=Arundo donax TaxID=35708 RepID=A0A0A8Z4H3_ARUDO